MQKYNYQTICHSNLLKDLPSRHKDVIARRFGLNGEKETLESIGHDFGITRERVRQIQDDSLNKLEGKMDLPIFRNVFHNFLNYFEKAGSLKRENLLIQDLGGEKFQNYVSLLLTVGKPFQRYGETEDFYSFWAIDRGAFNVARKTIDEFANLLNEKNAPMALPKGVLLSHIEISKNILKGSQGLYGLKHWPEINPRGIKDKAYLVMKQGKHPLHFTDVAKSIGDGALVQTVHNELIKDQRFVLVGRGLYALKEWGYEPGVVKEVIARTIDNAGGELDKDTIVEEVLKQRQVQPNTILLNLQNSKYFLKNSEGKYTIRRA
ncbi:MAG: hypothetical protein HYW69_01885 [Candidatus Nealsonbacteria bacterium]|nr:hypothetical protein [Candidatus Nealsonbacteria bacterium]